MSDTGPGRDGKGREGGPGLGTEPEEAPGPPLDGVGLHSHSNGYGSDIEEGVCSERRRGAEEPHHGLQVDVTTPTSAAWLSRGSRRPSRSPVDISPLEGCAGSRCTCVRVSL